jgi:hypothetical protein
MAEGTHDDKAPSIANLEVMLSADGLDPFTMEDGDDVDVSDGVDPFAVVEGDEDEVEDAALQHAGDDDDDDDDDDDEGEEQEDDEAERAAELDNFRIRLREKGYRERGVDPQRTPLVSSFDMRGIAEFMRGPRCKNVIVMCGAGISVSAGIPDFRTPGTGLYDNLQKYDLPTPQSIFELDYFRERPDAFYRLCAELWPDNYAPTPTHHFITELHARGLLRRCFTQVIASDCLELLLMASSWPLTATDGHGWPSSISHRTLACGVSRRTLTRSRISLVCQRT